MSPVVEAPRYATVHADVPAAEADHITGLLFELGATGVEERDGSTLVGPAAGAEATLIAHFPDEAWARGAATRLPARYRPRVELLFGDAWREGWKAFFKPTRVSPRLIVRPSWEPVPPGANDDVVLTVDPGNAFGSGTHETTRLVLREVDRRVRGGERVLDVGCGSGILSIAALLLGASAARAVDVDQDAVVATRENARLNRVAGRLRVSATPVERLRGRYDLVLANIQAPILIAMAGALRRRLAPDGALVLSGVLREQRAEVLAAFPTMIRRLVTWDGDWVALVLGRP